MLVRQIATVAAVAIMAAFAPGSAMAQGGSYLPRAAAGYDDGGFNPNEGPQPNGCVKWCPTDLTPCDPPLFKRTDGRCSYRN